MVSIAVINLDRDADRLAHMRAQLEHLLGLSFERLPAVKGSALPETLKPYFAGVTTLSPGEVGCYASHLVLLQRIADGFLAAPALILEDDVELPADFPALLESMLAAAPNDWDLIRLSNTAKRAYVNVAPLSGGRQIVRYSNVPGSTGAYLISAAGARKFLKRRVRVLPIDQDYRRVWAWDLNIFGVAPTPVRADIFDKSSIDAMAPEGLRRAKKRLDRMRRGRMAEVGARNWRNIRQLGLARWLGCVLVNALIVVTPRKQRPALLARAAAWMARP